MNPPVQAIQTLLSKTLPSDEIETIIKPIQGLPFASQKELSDAGLILSDFSIKAAVEYFRVVPETLKSISPEELGGWVGMGIRIAEQTSASGIRYFREGPAVFSKIPNRSAREYFIQLGASLAQQNPNLALIYYQQAPLFLTKITDDRNAIKTWAELGFALSDYTLAVEYFKTTPTLLQSLPMTLLPHWVGVAKMFAAAKLFFAITFIRTAPEIFSKIKTDPALILRLIEEVAAVSPELANSLFKELSCLSSVSVALIGPLLKKAHAIALFNVEAAKNLLLNSGNIVKVVGENSFLEWIDHGIRLFKTDGGGGGKGYFTLESKAAKDAANQLKGGMLLSACANVLQLFAEALCGRPVKIKPTADISETSTQPTTDGHAIYLPPHIRFFEGDQNFEWYKIATAFQAGYLEFGTFWPKEEEIADLIASLEEKYQRVASDCSLSSFLDLFPMPELIKQLFDIAEGARVEFHLRQEYIGLRPALVRMREGELANRSLLVGLLPHQIVVELLSQISLAGKTKEPIPQEFAPIVFECCRILGAVQDNNATVARSMKAAKSVYDLLEGTILPPPPAETTGPMEPLPEQGEKVRGKEAGSGEIRPAGVATPSLRGNIDPKKVEVASATPNGPLPLVAEGMQTSLPPDKATSRAEDAHLPTESNRSGLAGVAGATGLSGAPVGAVYDEWDCEADDYRPGFCRVIEKEVVPHGEDFAEQVMAEYGGMIKSIKRAFQYLAPEGMVWVKGEYEGDQIDLDRLIEKRVETVASSSSSNRIYMHRRKKERSVASAFLIDMSGSTAQRLSSGKSVLQIEKETLVLLSHAIDAVGDRFALYGFSGRGNNSVLFYILKDFQARYTREVDLRIGNVSPLGQNRDGAAIRHATSRLLGETAQTKILVLISDGKPLDDSYTGSYAVADTKKALREARQKGIDPFCITVDQEGAEYLPGMYGDVAYMVVDQIETLPVKLPQIYRRLTT